MKLEDMLTEQRKEELWDEMLVENKKEFETLYKKKLSARVRACINKAFIDNSTCYPQYPMDAAIQKIVLEECAKQLDKIDMQEVEMQVKKNVEKQLNKHIKNIRVEF